MREYSLRAGRGPIQQHAIAHWSFAELPATPHLLVARPAWLRGFESEKVSRRHGFEAAGPLFGRFMN
jgi:hypothetical protein